MNASESHALMARELDEQPNILAEAARALAGTASRIALDRTRPVWVGGCGDSLFAARAIAHHARKTGIDIRPASAAEMLWDAPIAAGDTVIAISLSGGTRRTVEALTAAGTRGARTIAITLRPDSALGEAADDVVALPYTPVSRAIPHGLDYHVTLLALASLMDDPDPDAIATLFHGRTPCAHAAADAAATGMAPDGRFFFLGSGAALGSAEYGAAKMHEAGGLTAFAFESENFAHGAQFMLRPGDHATLCGADAAGDARTLSLRDGLGQLGVGHQLAGFDAPLGTLGAAFDAALTCQALCLAVAQARGLNVTDPANGSGADAVQKDWFGWTAP
ncbi:SIS domain-containing protein [Palleronia salina]|uniref:SIS domain-containing protein n=1 Tax=Palleronia salina TaxID=313368 RepID=A0A1M6LWL5_9RHOB|nr:SIS domain-containing protein [Palleronia salina]SHJ75552.1 SIS domain-containing protein [Palleronia salina]